MAILAALLVVGALAVGLMAAGRTMNVPDFAVAVSLSKAAESKLHSINESIIVTAFFDGDGEPEPGKSTAPFRNVFLGNETEAINDKNIAEFRGKKIPIRAWKRLSDKNYYVTINVGSARKAAADNLLDCGASEYRIESIKGTTVEVHCTLIGEPKAPNQ